MEGRRVRRWQLIPVAIALAIGLCGWRAVDVRRYRSGLAEAQADLDGGRFALAANKLTALVTWKPGSDEAWYLLGTCEAARGRDEAAEAAWSHIAPGSPFAPRAIQGRLQIEAGAGRLARAEDLVLRALADPRIDGASLPILLSPIYCQEGRLEETLGLLEARWKALDAKGEGASEAAVNLVRAHAGLRLNPVPRQAIRDAMDQAAALAPGDDRIWLGRANLAIDERALDEARRRLEDCLRRRPDDVPVWRSWLRWAMASGRSDEVDRALGRLPAAGVPPAELRRIVAWRVGRLADPTRERRAIDRLLEVDPADTAAMERLAALTATMGDAAVAAEIRDRRAEVERRQRRYRSLEARGQPLRDAAEMARLAVELGEWFEARGFLTLAEAVGDGRNETLAVAASLRSAPRPMRAAGSLAAAVAAEEAAGHGVR
ncbi:hypothetical protein OJF2_13250 [Aquisphaera giovannonii]|uniref:Tetratricopeptide repeat protein n=1 Tax=Aquisphaera giovannonii TaxID=406548 RepID=A0A5B9VY55_9BACT|nr:hypothetical protein [Aquisphaera giovannonii]QEH32841.1 hypothetical protein OJF2_13250 [Aquisphaera giovannonii]